MFIEYSKETEKQILRLNGIMQKRILRKIEAIASGSVIGRPLNKPLQGYRKLRVGHMRIVYHIESDLIHIVTIERRDHVYKKK